MLAVGHTLVYRLTGIVHVALGDLVGLGVFIALFVTSGRRAGDGGIGLELEVAAGLVVALLATAALGNGSCFAVIPPVRNAGLDPWLGRVDGGIVLAAAVTHVIRRTSFGRGLQAIAADVDGACIVGVPAWGIPEALEGE